MRVAAEAKQRMTSHRESRRDRNKLFAKLVPFALGERQDPGEDSNWKAAGWPGFQ